MNPLLSLGQAQARLLAMAEPLPSESVTVAEATGRTLAEPVLAKRNQPPADLSAMDGYALGASSPSGRWQVIGESAAGRPFNGAIALGEAVRISTGALVPQGTIAILLQEDATRQGDRLHLGGDTPLAGRHIRREGFDFRAGDTLLPAGTRLTPVALALVLAGGHGRVIVHRKPRVVVIDNGDELAADPAQCAPHQIPASNGAMLSGMAAAAACAVTRIGPVADDLTALAAEFDQAGDANLIVTSGGASVGDHDLVRPALEAWGAQIDFWRVALKPGKPVMVARRGQQLVLGLPGNPVSSYVTAFLFMLPLLRAMSGATATLPREMHACAAAALPAVGKRQEFLRARWDGATIAPMYEQDSSALVALAASNALLIRPAEAPATEAGTSVPFYWLENGGIA